MIPALTPEERAAWPWKITIDNDGTFVIVDEIDYDWALTWRWHAHPDRHGRKFYARRVTRDRAARKQFAVYMHKEILKRDGKVPPSPRHTMGDHGNGAEWDNRRGNLDWATPQMNRLTARAPGARAVA